MLKLQVKFSYTFCKQIVIIFVIATIGSKTTIVFRKHKYFLALIFLLCKCFDMAGIKDRHPNNQL